MSNLFALDLDLAFDDADTIADTLRLANDMAINAGCPDLAISVVNESGPAAGWPEIRFTGSLDQLTRLANTIEPDSDAIDFIRPL